MLAIRISAAALGLALLGLDVVAMDTVPPPLQVPPPLPARLGPSDSGLFAGHGRPGGGHVDGHTAAILLIDGDGLIVDRLPAEAAPDRLAERLTAPDGKRPQAEAPAR